MALTDEDREWVKAVIAYAARIAVMTLVMEINRDWLETAKRDRYAESVAERVRALIEVYEPGKTYIGPDI